MCSVAAPSQCVLNRSAINSIPISFIGDQDNWGDLVHLGEDFGKSGSELEPLACLWRSVCVLLYADDSGIVSKSREDLAKMTVIVTVFDTCRYHRARTDNRDNAAPHTQQGSPVPAALCRGVGPEMYLQTMHSLYLGVFISMHAPTSCHYTKDLTRVGMLPSFSAWDVLYGRLFVFIYL